MDEEEQLSLFGDEWVLIDRDEAIRLLVDIIQGQIEEQMQGR